MKHTVSVILPWPKIEFSKATLYKYHPLTLSMFIDWTRTVHFQIKEKNGRSVWAFGTRRICRVLCFIDPHLKADNTLASACTWRVPHGDSFSFPNRSGGINLISERAVSWEGEQFCRCETLPGVHIHFKLSFLPLFYTILQQVDHVIPSSLLLLKLTSKRNS